MTKIREGYLNERLKEELVLELEDMTKTQWKFLKEIFGFQKNENVVRIVLPEKTMIKSFIDNE